MGSFRPSTRLAESSHDVFASLEEQATQNAWWEALRLPRTWITEHSLLALHVWILHNRFKVDYNVEPAEFNGRRMQEELFERFWEDTTRRIRNAGIAELSVGKQLESVQRITLDDMHAYDAAVRTLEEDDGMELAAAVWRGVYREHAGADTEAVLALADYARRETLALVAQPREDVYRGWISWGPCVGETQEDRLARQRRMLEGEWREALDPAGRVFFYHTSTHERAWEPPAEGFYPRRRYAITRYLEENPGAAAAGALLQPLPSASASADGAAAAGTRLFASTQRGADRKKKQ
jgi:cytochrome b pre-mRNA-processing protein 3